MILSVILGAASPARAEWREASSPHFLVYSNDSVEDVRAAALKLERFHRVVRWASNVTKEDPPVKMRVFLLGTMGELQKTMVDGGGRGVMGYYTMGGRGPAAFGLRRDPRDVKGIGADEVLFHEYTHHLMFQYFPAVYPPWYQEGFAEFYGRTRIGDDDVVEIGHAALARYLQFGDWLPLPRLLTARSGEDIRMNWHAVYSQGWLLVHYLANTESRKGQLDQYLRAINAGASYEEAMNKAFGPGAKALDSELRSYSRKSAIPATRIPFKPIDASGISVRTLSASEQALIHLEMKFSRGVLQREAEDFAHDVRSVTERFPDDPYALSMLTEAEHAAGNPVAAEQAVDRWLAMSSRDARALMHKAELQVEKLKVAGSSNQADWKAARDLLVAAVRADQNDARILEAYYDSFTAEGVLPTPGAQNGLFRAFDLVPQDEGIRYKLARDFEQRGMIADAISIIKPAAFALHEGSEESESEKRRRERRADKYREVGETKFESAREMLARLEAKLASTAVPASTN